MEERIELSVPEAEQRAGGTSVAVGISVAFHILLIILFIRAATRTVADQTQNIPMARYVEFLRDNPREFVEAPGPAISQAPLNAPLSDANRKASAPEPAGETPTRRPGDDSGIYTPPIPPPGNPQAAPQQAQQGENVPDVPQRAERQTAPLETSPSSRMPALRNEAQMLGGAQGINWGSAIREAAKVASLGQDLDLSGADASGGERGTAEQGPLSFETQWYDWGAYAQSMISRIRVNWYQQMPQLIRSGLKGVVTIRFTIHRDGHISDVTMLETSSAPPYDFAARKAIELSSPLNPLPGDFPNATERVTARFFYNSKPPVR